MRESRCFYGCRNALLPFAKQNRSRAGAIPVCFADVGTRHCHSRNQIGTAHCPGTMSVFYGCKNVPLPFAERFISCLSEKPAAGDFFRVLPFRIRSKTVFFLVLRCFLSPFLKVFGHFGSPRSQNFHRKSFHLKWKKKGLLWTLPSPH